MPATLFQVALRRAADRKRITLRVSNATGEVVLTIPERTEFRTGPALRRRHGDWIATRLAKVPERVAFEPGAVVPLRGVPHRIVHWSKRAGRHPGHDRELEGRAPSSPSRGERPCRRAGSGNFSRREARKDLAAR